MNAPIRSVLSVAVLGIAAVATIATSSQSNTTLSTSASRGIALSPASPIIVEHVTMIAEPGGQAASARAIVLVEGSATPVGVRITRDSDGSVVEHDGQGTFAPFLACTSLAGCEATFSIRLTLQGLTATYSSLDTGLSITAEVPQPSGTKLSVTIDP